jgi:hypothetical protein
MVGGWSQKRILIVVKTYPVPAWKGIEVSCTAGVTEDRQWIRLFPVPYRYLDGAKQFQKYEWIKASVIKATDDPRPESFKLNADTITIGEQITSANEWRARREIIKPLIKPSMCGLQRERDAKGSPTLGLFKPARIKRLVIEETANSGWTQQELAKLRQTLLFQTAPSRMLEKLPFEFRYEFECSEPGCTGHKMLCTDWEIGESYRRWRKQYRNNWEHKFRLRYEDQMITKSDTHFFVGTVHQHPDRWIIVGLFYPPREPVADLFD